MADFTIKQHDTWPPIEATLSDESGPLNLTGATVRMILKVNSPSATPISHTCTIVNAATGVVRWDWVPSDTANVNTYQAEWEITWADGTITTCPNEGYKEVKVVADLG